MVRYFDNKVHTASSEQAQGIEQVNKAVAEMDKVVQQVTSTAEESASSSEEMKVQAKGMKDLVGELSALVGGKVDQATMTGNQQVHKGATAVKRVAPRKMKALAAPIKKGGPRPEDVIPLDEDNFTDFLTRNID